VGLVRPADSVGETPTDATEPVALPEKPLIIGALYGPRRQLETFGAGTPSVPSLNPVLTENKPPPNIGRA
jgi:hypothetical protein